MNITIRKGNAWDLPAFVNLLQLVREEMANKEWFYLDPPEVFRKMMDSGIMHLWLAEDAGKVVGVFDILIPGLESFNYGYELNFTQEQLMCVVNMDSVGIHPEYRGLGLQRKLLETAHKWLGGRGPCILLCTIHPDNCYSLQNALKLGYEIRKQVSIYDSIRYILQKNI